MAGINQVCATPVCSCLPDHVDCNELIATVYGMRIRSSVPRSSIAKHFLYVQLYMCSLLLACFIFLLHMFGLLNEHVIVIIGSLTEKCCDLRETGKSVGSY